MQVLKKPNTQEEQWNGPVCNSYKTNKIEEYTVDGEVTSIIYIYIYLYSAAS